MPRKQTDHMAEDTQLTFTFDGRHWRVRGLEKQLSSDRLRLTLHVSRGELSFVDTIDLYLAAGTLRHPKAASRPVTLVGRQVFPHAGDPAV